MCVVSRLRRVVLASVVAAWALGAVAWYADSVAAQGQRSIQILFLGHNSKHHDSARFRPMLFTALEPDNIKFTYTADPNDLNPATLAKSDGLMIYANHNTITPEQESIDTNGLAFVPLTVNATSCARNVPTSSSP